MRHVSFAHHDLFVHGSLRQYDLWHMVTINEVSSIPLILLKCINISNGVIRDGGANFCVTPFDSFEI